MRLNVPCMMTVTRSAMIRSGDAEEEKAKSSTPRQGRRAKLSIVNKDLNDFEELEGGQREDLMEKAGSCRSTMINDAGCQGPCGPMQEVSSSCSSSDAENHVICVDIHRPQPKRWKLQK